MFNLNLFVQSLTILITMRKKGKIHIWKAAHVPAFAFPEVEAKS